MRPTAAHLEQFLAHLEDRDTRSATDLALRLADDGATLPELFASLIAPAQAEVGHRWASNRYGVADEHAATAIVEVVVAVLSTQVPPSASGGRSVVLACPEGEWHLLPARLTAEVLRWGGCAVDFLGGSLPPSHLARHLSSSSTEVVALSCTTPLAFPGLRAAVEVAHAAGRPVLLGGRALGPDDHRARALGGDLFAPDAGTALELLHGPLPRTLASPQVSADPSEALLARRRQIVEESLAGLADGLPDYTGYDAEQRARTAEDLDHLIDIAAAALLVDDPTVLTDAVVWLDEILRHRGVPAGVLERSLGLLESHAAHPDFVELMSAARDRLVHAAA